MKSTCIEFVRLPAFLKNVLPLAIVAAAFSGLVGCQSPAGKTTSTPATTSTKATATVAVKSSHKTADASAKRFTYTPRPYPVDERGFSPVDKVLAKAYAREETIADDAEGSLNPYVMKVIS